MRKTQTSRRGISLIWTALLTVIMIGFVGLACDVGYGLLVAHQLQNAADASALAGALAMTKGEDEARLAAVNMAGMNMAGGAAVQLSPNEAKEPEGDLVLGRYDRSTGEFTPGVTAANAVKVVARRTDESLNGPLPMIFGRVFGVETVNVERMAIAQNKGTIGAGLIALCPDCPKAFELTGTADLTVNFGGIQVNSNDPCAVRATGSPTLTAVALNVVGEICASGNASLPTNTATGVSPVDDPLADIPEPTWDPAFDLGVIDVGGIYSAGYYSGGIDLTGGNVTLLPGIYIVDGAGLHVGGNTNLIAEGVMVYIPPGTGDVKISGNGVVRISPPDPELEDFPGVDVYDGISIFQSRTNNNEATTMGTSAMDLDGTFYFPAAHVEIGGTGADLGGQGIAYTIHVFGRGFSLSWDGNFPSYGSTVFLVQ